MSTSETDVLDRIRDHFLHAIKARDHLHQRLDTIMNYLPDLIVMGKSLMAERDDLKSDRDAQKARAEAAEQERDALKAEKAADEDSAKAALAVLGAEVEAERPTAVTSTTPTGATVTVDPAAGTTTHVDPVAGITTTVDNASGAATAVDAASASVEPTPAVVAEAVSAAASAGVAVPTQG